MGNDKARKRCQAENIRIVGPTVFGRPEGGRDLADLGGGFQGTAHRPEKGQTKGNRGQNGKGVERHLMPEMIDGQATGFAGRGGLCSGY